MNRQFPLHGLLLWFLLAQAMPSMASDQARVLVIHSYSLEYQWVRDINQGIEERLDDSVDLVHHYMDTKQRPRSEFPQAAQTALEALHTATPQLVIICDDNGLRLVGETIAQHVPVVFCGINGDLRADFPWASNHDNVTGVMERPLVKRTIFEVIKATGMNVERS